MTQVRITHNPFTVETTFTLDGVELTEGARLHRRTKQRLQSWVDELFGELKTMFNGQDAFNVTFVGVEPDFHDIVQAAQDARGKGMTVSVAWEPVASAEQREKALVALRVELLRHPGYQSILKDDAATRAALTNAASHDFDVYVVATMSSGKSTLINAMLGRDLLPSGNEATTAAITRIFDDEKAVDGKFRGARYDAAGEILEHADDVDLALMSNWNRNPETRRIELHGKIAATRNGQNARLVLTDTPGPNNSADAQHATTTMSYIQDTNRSPLILYVLNATQQGIEDDSKLLKLVAKTIERGGRQSNDRFIFVLNKMDEMDVGKGDDVSGLLSRTRTYLQKHGVHNPQIFPVSAHVARLVRYPDEALSSRERSFKPSLLHVFDSEPTMDLSQYVPVRGRGREASADGGASEQERRTGMPALESTLDAYVEKYHLPDRFKRSYDALIRLIEEAINRQRLLEDMEASNLTELSTELAQLRDRYDTSLNGKVFAEQIASQSLDLPEEVEKELQSIKEDVKALERECASAFTGEAALAQARELVETWRGRFDFKHKEVINRYELAYETGQKAIKEGLQDHYALLMQSVFNEAFKVKFPALARIMRTVAGLTFDFELGESHSQTRSVPVGTEKVSKSRWYNPFSWFSMKEVSIYREEAFVNLNEFYKDQLVTPLTHFRKIESSARKSIESGRDTLIEVFIAHVREEFQPRIEELFAESNARIEDRDRRKHALAEATETRHWSEAMAVRLHDVLSLERAPA